MKVAMVVPRFPSVAETFVVSRFLGFLERNIDVHVFGEVSDDKTWSWFSLGSHVRRRVHPRTMWPSHLRIAAVLPFELIRTLVAAPWRTLRYIARGFKAYGRGIAGHFVEDAALIRFGPDLVHFEFGNLAVGRERIGALLGARVAVSFQGWDINYVGLERPRYYDEVWRTVDAAHFVSDELLERARRRGMPATTRTFVVRNGIDLKTFEPRTQGTVEKIGTISRPVRLLSVGRLHWKKGYGFALQALRELIDSGTFCEYRIVGDGDFAEAIRFDVSDLGLDDHVVLTGPLPAGGVRDALEWADVFVHPATSEGFCLAVTEAQAMMVPVVASDADGLRENVADGESGFIVPRRDAGALAQAISRLITDASLRDDVGRAGRARVEKHFDLAEHVDGIVAMYEQLLT